MNKKILIFTSQHDVHADAVVEVLQRNGHAPFRLNSEDIPGHIDFNFNLSGHQWSGYLYNQLTGEPLDVADVGAVWLRKPGDFTFPDHLLPQERAFAKEEIDHTLFSFLHSLDGYWMSHPKAIRSASWKGEQLQRAVRMGFEVPRSLISNRPDEVRQFIDTCANGCIFKVMSTPTLAWEKVEQEDRTSLSCHTTLITEAEIALLESVNLVPCLFQEYIPKQCDLRITVVGEALFAAEIHSQSHPKTIVDYRHYEVPIPYLPTTLPTGVAELCLQFVRSYGLEFGVIDMVATPDGRYVFMENNPVGQFIFVEQLVPELRMTDAVAERLLQGAKG